MMINKDGKTKLKNRLENKMTYLLPWVALDLWEFEFSVIWIHLFDLIPCWCTQYFDDFNQLINTRIAWEYWLAQK